MASANDSYSLPHQPALSHPISIMDIFFPGFTNISAAFQQLQSNNTNSYAQMICICGIAVFLGRYAYNSVKEFVDTYCTTTVHISDTDEAYDMLLTWLSSQPFASNASSTLASVAKRKRRFSGEHSDGSVKKPLQYSPWNGAFFFWYKKHLLTLRTEQRDDRFYSKEDIAISCIGRSSKILKDLLNECRATYLASVQTKTSIFKHHGSDWDKTSTVDIRHPDTVMLDKKKKTALLEDIECFLESQAWYSARGIPHRKGYLLHGPPGTGKSSLSLLIAGKFDLDIYILNVSSVDDDSLDELFSGLPARCLVLLEDIDAVNTTHSRRPVALRQGNTSSSSKESMKGNVSLSALLNVIDGINSPEGRVLIMTTNHPDRLDDALIRPGRVDVKLKLGLTTHDINAQLFSNIFGYGTLNEKDKAEENETLRKLAAEFADKVPENEFSPAEIQLFLVANRKSPAMAVHNLQEWIVRVREEKNSPNAPAPCEESSSGSVHNISLNEPHPSSATPQVGVQAREVPVAALETSETVAESHCCSCQVIEDIRGICMRERIPSVEKSLLLTHLSDLKTCRGVSAVRGHSTDKFFNLLLNFVKKYHASIAERCSAQPAASPTYPSLTPISASREISIQPEPKIITNSENFAAPTAKKLYVVSELEKFWDEGGWQHVALGSNDAASKEPPDDDASSGTSFESGSQVSCDVGDTIRQTEVVEESAEVETKSKLYRQPATPPASPVPPTAGMLAGSQVKRDGASIAEWRRY